MVKSVCRQMFLSRVGSHQWLSSIILSEGGKLRCSRGVWFHDNVAALMALAPRYIQGA